MEEDTECPDISGAREVPSFCEDLRSHVVEGAAETLDVRPWRSND
jgi:hypothetical protein